MKYLAEALLTIVAATSWLAGLVFASGFWLTTAAVFFPPYAWYLVVERVIRGMGWL